MRKHLAIFIIIMTIVYLPSINGTSYIFSHLGKDYTNYIKNDDEVLLQNHIDWDHPNKSKIGLFNPSQNIYSNKTLIIDHQENLFNQLYYFETSSTIQSDGKIYQQRVGLGLDSYLLIGYYVLDPLEQFMIKRPFIEYYQKQDLVWSTTIEEINGEIVDFVETDYGYVLLISHQLHYYDYSMAVYEISHNGQIVRKYLFDGNKADIPSKILFMDNHFVILASTNSQTGNFYQNSNNDFQIAVIYLTYPNYQVAEICYFGNSGDDRPIDIITLEQDYYILVQFSGEGYFQTGYFNAPFYGIVHLSSRLEYVKYYPLSFQFKALGIVKQGQQIVVPYINTYSVQGSLCYVILSSSLAEIDYIQVSSKNSSNFVDFFIASSNTSFFIIEKLINPGYNSDQYQIYSYFHNSNKTSQAGLTLNGKIASVLFNSEVLTINYHDNEMFKTIEAVMIDYNSETNNVSINGVSINSIRINDLDGTVFGYYDEYTKHQGDKITVFTKNILNIPFQGNISGGTEYDLNTVIHFNGTGLLNDIPIESGYKITEPGKYLLEVIGNNDFKIISFTITELSQDIYYEESKDELKPQINLKSLSNYQPEIEYSEFIIPNIKQENPVFMVLCGMLISIIIGYLLSKVNFKKILIIVGFLIIFTNDNFNLQATSDYLLFKEELEYLEIIDTKHEALILKENNKYIFKHQDIRLELPNASEFQLEFINNKYIVFFYENRNLKVLEIDSVGMISNNKILLTKVTNFSVHITDKGYLIVGGVYNDLSTHPTIDAIIQLIDFEYNLLSEKVFTGDQNEWFESAIILEDELVVSGYKDQLSGGEFGNGGKFNKNNLFICKLNYAFEVISIEVVNTTNRIFSFINHNNNYYIVTTNEIIVLNEDLLITKAIKTRNIIYSYVGNELIILFDSMSIFSYQLDNLYLEYQETICTTEELIYDIVTVDDSFYVYINSQVNKKVKQIDLVKLINFYPHLIVGDYNLLPYENVGIKTAFQDGKLIDYFSTPYYDRLLDGRYVYTLDFQIRNSKLVQIEVPLEVMFECNVSDNQIYPIGYRLLFTGYATLNNQEVFNNYQINQAGNYELILENANKEKQIINFTIDKGQYQFLQTPFTYWDNAVFKEEQLILTIKLKKQQFDNLIEIKFQDKIPDSIEFIESDEILNIYFTAPKLEGLYVYFFEKIIFQNQVVVVNKPYIVNVLKEKPSFTINSLDDFVFNILINDEDKTLRYLELKLITDKQEYFYNYSLNDQQLEVNIPDVNNEVLVVISYAYDIGDNIIRTTEVLSISVSANQSGKSLKLGSLDVLRSSETIEELSLNISNSKHSKITKIVYNNQQHFIEQENYRLAYIITILASLITLTTSIFVFKKITKNKAQQD